jgi:RNA polymerase sigma factor (sigma-70 family)
MNFQASPNEPEYGCDVIEFLQRDSIKRMITSLVAGFFPFDKDCWGDVVQECALKAWKYDVNSLQKRSDAQLFSWIRCIAINVCKDRVREKKRKPIDYFATFPSVRSSCSTPFAIVSEFEISRFLQDALECCLNDLVSEFRVLLVMRIDDFSYAEIADVLKTDEKGVKSTLYRARCSLRRLMLRRHKPLLREVGWKV